MALGIFVCSCVTVAAVWQFSMRMKVGSLRAEVREAGYPITLEELQAWYETPASDQNAADLYIKAFKASPALPREDLESVLPLLAKGRLPKPPGPLPEAMADGIGKFLAANVETMKCLHEAGLREASRYPIDLTNGSKTQLPHLAMLQHATAMLCLEALLRAQQDDRDGAVDSLISALHAGRSLNREPLMFSQMVRTVCTGTVAATLEEVLALRELNDGQLSRLDKAFARAEDESRGYVRGLAGERAMAAHYFSLSPSKAIEGTRNSSIKDSSNQLPGGELDGFYAVTGRFGYGQIWYLREMNRLVKGAEGPVEGLPAVLDSLKEDLAQASAQYNVGRILFDASLKSVPYYLRDVALLRVIRTALALERYRIREGYYPERVQELVPKDLRAVAIDPFSNQPLQTTTKAKAHVVYSVGPNRVDDGGVDEMAEMGRRGGMLDADVVFTLVR
jgi:hypothetical protein